MKSIVSYSFLLLISFRAEANPVSLSGLEILAIPLIFLMVLIGMGILALLYSAHKRIVAKTITTSKLVLFLLPSLWLGGACLLPTIHGAYQYLTSSNRSSIDGLDVFFAAINFYSTGVFLISLLLISQYRASR